MKEYIYKIIEECRASHDNYEKMIAVLPSFDKAGVQYFRGMQDRISTEIAHLNRIIAKLEKEDIK